MPRKYNTNERIAFFHGYAYAKAEFLKENEPKYKDTPVNVIVNEIIKRSVDEHGTQSEKQVMPIVNGESFYCECGCNVFTKRVDGILECNSCPLEYLSEY